MKRKSKHLLFLVSLFFIAVTFTKCEKAVECDGTNGTRVGAMCNDGTKSNVKGSGACSGHNGVSYWLCK